MIVSCVFCRQICRLARFLSLDRPCIPFSFHHKCCNKSASLITWFSPINVCKSLLSVLYSTVVDLADPITLHPVSAVLGTRQASFVHSIQLDVFFSDCHLAPKFFKVVVNSKIVCRHFQKQTKPCFTLSAFLIDPSKLC